MDQNQTEIEDLEEEVDKAIEEARQRVGDTMAELLTAPAMTQEEMDALEEKTE